MLSVDRMNRPILNGSRGLRTGELPGYKPGRQWRMTPDDIEASIESLRPTQLPQPPRISDVPSLNALRPTSRRRLLRSE